MNPQSDEDLQKRLQNLEAEINTSSSKKYQSQSPEQSSYSSFTSVNSQIEKTSRWFNSLSTTGKVVAVTVGVLLGFAVVQAVFRFIASAISLAVLAGLVYLGYKFIVSGNRQRKQ